ncbi:NAD(P)/FAD-dependent oxidoreductase [Thetidibacter halocola]|uniref:FAD-dependent oxidoreductase n=1 Tax=Thetidibacter halocola TaxID=2827239 RepID=A0A8J7W989_9RHOB|nr:NAD(P)/FAD-dependent oxidoreductase [Thetidibacter halocola]MBS0123295.1 FAD-dependent oxidoreductase [Thetidibacter halocola]
MSAPRVAIVGGGPAGLSAAIALRRTGIGPVIVIDRDPAPGGIPRHCGHYPFGWREFRRLYRGPDYARRLVAEARAAGVTILSATTVTAIHAGPVLELSSHDGLSSLLPERVLLATGCRETPRAPRAVGGTKPAGIATTGTLQTMVYGSGLRPFRAPVILGTELVAFSALITATHAGIRPVAMVEPGPRATARFPAALFPSLHGIPLLTGTSVEAVEGHDKVEAVILRDRNGTRRLVCDGLLVTGRFRPDAVLLRDSGIEADPATGGPVVDAWGRTSLDGVFAAGNLLRPAETAGWCWDEGRRVAGAIAASLAGGLPAPPPRLTLADPVLGWAMPQRPSAAGTEPRLHLRLSRPARGQVVATGGAGDRVGFAVDSRPERRIVLEAATLPAGPVTLTFREDPA